VFDHRNGKQSGKIPENDKNEGNLNGEKELENKFCHEAMEGNLMVDSQSEIINIDK
jgi:hypothetical protein